MPVVISKEDLTGAIKTATATATPIPTNTLTQINEILRTADMLLKNPMVQRLLVRFGSKLGFGISPQNNPTSITTSTSQLNPENTYTLILNTVDSIMKVAGDIPLSMVKDYLEKNKESVTKLIADSLKPKPLEPKKVVMTDGTKPKS